MNTGNKGFWNSRCTRLLLAALLLSAAPLQAQTMSAGSVSVGPTATLTYSGSTILYDGLTISQNSGGTLTLSGSTTYGNLTVLGSGNLTISGVLTSGTIISAGTLTVNGAGSTVISGTAGLTKNGGGILILSGSNTYGGGTVISPGILQVGTPAPLISGSTTSGVLTLNGATAGLTVTGSGTLVLSGSNTYSGTTTISGGVIQLSGSAPIMSGGVLHIPETTEEESSEVTVAAPLNIVTIPEPSVIGLLVAAAVGVGLTRPRRKR